MTYKMDVCNLGPSSDAFGNFTDHVRDVFQSSERYRNKTLQDALDDELNAVGAKNIRMSVYIEFETEEDATMFKLKWL